ncbi:phage tail tape measure protein [Rhodococcus aetherivorans]|uniref:phage tail tape measure protein n=1 Tax=Rhodococcus aetherivorans TaxID=191292 RepID=UPI002948C575|nr:phage tail tape measure protein [Rhodococcus aetherivorans]MDV6293309.1 phage tail tape measure protein [Rhodococcus aetherivorans]
MAGVELATAYVAITAETSGLARDIQRDVGRAGNRAADDFASQFTRGTRGLGNDVGRDIGRAGARAGDDFTSNFTGQLGGIEGSVGDALGGAGGTAGRAGGEAGGGFLGGFGDALGGAGGLAGKAGPIGAALAGIAGVGLMAGKELAQAVMDGMGMQQSRDLIQARLGVNDATMATIGTAAADAFTNAWGESVGANVEAAQLAIQGGILNGEETAGQMQPVIEKLNVVTDLMGGEMTDTVRAVSALMKNGLVDSSTEAFDVITRGFQMGGNLGDDLIDTMSEYSNGWKQTGFSAEFAMGLVNQAMQNGVDNTDRAGDAIREFGRRMVEEGDTIKGAIGELGLPVEELFTDLKEGGEDGEAAFDRIFDAIRTIEDPLQRAAVTQALLGDTAGDFMNAFGNWDPSRAVAALGQVEGATAKVAEIMGSNPGTAWTEALNTITVQADQLKLSLADAFTPALGDTADWVKDHKPEIIAFFTELGTTALSTVDAFVGFSSGALRAWSVFADGMSQMVTPVVGALGGMVGLSADFLDMIPGMGDQADEMRGISDAMLGFSDTLSGAGDTARSLADGLDSMRPGLQAARDGLREGGEAAENTSLLMRALGDSVKMVPDSKDIIISSNSPKRQEELEKLGLTVRELPDGTFQVFANTAEGQRIVDDFVHTNQDRNIDMKIRLHYESLGAQNDRIVAEAAAASAPGGSGYVRYASGGRVSGPGTGTSDSIPAWLSNGEFVVNARSARKAMPLLEWINAPGFAAGGLFDRDAAISTARAHDGEPYVYGGLDCSGYLSAVFNAGTGQGVRFVTGSDFASMGWERGYDPNGFSIGTDGGVGMNGHMAGTLYGVNIESDGSNGIQYGRGADGATDFPMVWHWPGASGGDNPALERLTGGSNPGPQVALGGGSFPSGGGGTSTGGSRGGGDGRSSTPGTASAVAVFVTNWPDGTRTVDTFTGAPIGDPAPLPSTADYKAKQEGQPEPYDVQARLAKYGEDVGKVAADAALEILGIEGTLLDPNHRFWQAGRDIAEGFAQQREAAAGEQNVDNSVTVQANGLIDGRIVDEIARRVAQLQNRNMMRYNGRP